MASPAEVVAAQFAQAQSYVNNAQSQLSSFTSALNTSIYAPPTLSVTWNSIAAPTLPSLPAAPSLPAISFVAPAAPGALNLAAPSVTIDDFTEVAPVLNLPAAPTLNYGAAPTIPAVANIATPSAPLIELPAAPVYLSLSTPTFAGIDLHADYLAKLDDMPTLVLAAPTPYSYALGPEYASTLLTELKAKLLERMNGGTGLPAAVEQAIWDRARSRETQIALADEAEVMRASEALGFQLPSGVLAAQLREAQKSYYDKLSSLSRDVAIKQAELEQANLKETIDAGMRLESQLIDYSYKLEQIAFDSAKQYAENAIQIYNAQVEQFKALLAGYQTYAAAYKTLIDGELAKVEVYKAQLAGEQAKADINRVLVEQYKASIEAGLSQVKIYEAQVVAANTLVQIEQVKIAAAGEQIRAYTAQINAETAKVEAYKAGVQAEATKTDIYKVKADAFSAKVNAQAEKARADLSQYTALVQAKTAEWEGYRAQVEAERSRIAALGEQSGALLDGYKAATTAIVAEAEMQTRVWETEIKNYEAGQQVAIQAGKVNADSVIATNNARLDAAKVGAQVYAQLTASAYGMVNASASVSGSGSTSVSYSYSNDTTAAVAPITSV